METKRRDVQRRVERGGVRCWRDGRGEEGIEWMVVERKREDGEVEGERLERRTGRRSGRDGGGVRETRRGSDGWRD